MCRSPVLISTASCSRRRFVIGAATLWLAVGHASARADEAELSEAIYTFAREKSAAEQVVVMLKENAVNDASKLSRGVLLYADAKAAFDGLIEQLEYDLQGPNSPQASETFDSRLQAAVQKRVAFVSFVTEDVLPPAQPGSKGPLGDIIKGAGDLIKALTDAGVTVWREVRNVSKDQRDDVRAQLDRQKWRPFGQIS
jgi:cytochrome c1